MVNLRISRSRFKSSFNILGALSLGILGLSLGGFMPKAYGESLSTLTAQANATGGSVSSSNLITGTTEELAGDQTCQGTGGILAYAETKDFKLYVCADDQDLSQPRYYRSVNKNGSQGIRITAKTYNPNQGNYFEFFNGDYVYLIQIPSETLKQPMLVVEFPDGSGYEQKISRFLLSREARSLLSSKSHN
ncbi:MAG: hypothetical protein NW214_01875 [Pseudanabaenaceae cyanobacterium bins.39]|nr:hypothetical protein [Pseudanabaenaceae cyanobacterium bins.39]